MTLTDRLLSELARLGSATHPMARTLPGIVRDSQRWTRRLMALLTVCAFLMGFFACWLWQGVKLETLAQNVEAWRATAEVEYRTHHKPVNVSEGQARGIVGMIERRKEGGE